MKLPAYFPQPAEISRETLAVLLGALLAALIVGQLPGVKEWMREQWR